MIALLAIPPLGAAAITALLVFRPRWAFRPVDPDELSIEQWAQLRLALGHMIALGGVIPPGPAERPSRGRSSSRRPRDTFSPAGPRLSSLQPRLGTPFRSGPPTSGSVAHATSE